VVAAKAAEVPKAAIPADEGRSKARIVMSEIRFDLNTFSLPRLVKYGEYPLMSYIMAKQGFVSLLYQFATFSAQSVKN
jgi:hypothetical protein